MVGKGQSKQVNKHKISPQQRKHIYKVNTTYLLAVW